MDFYKEYDIDQNKLTRDYVKLPLKKRELPNKEDLEYLYNILSIKELNLYFQKSGIDQTIKKYGIKISKEVSNMKRERSNLKKYGYKHLCNRPKHREKLNIAAKSIERKEKIKETCLRKYGVENYTKTTDYQNKSKETCLRKYGVESTNILDWKKDKSKETCLRKYGVENVSKLVSIKKQKHKTATQNNPLDPYNSAKAQKTILTRYNGPHAYRNLSKQELSILQTKSLFKKEIEKYNGNIIKMASDFGVGFSTLYRYIHQYQINFSYKKKNTSIYEDVLVSQFPTEEIETNVRILNGKEIDIYFPKHKIGIEFNGSYWHSNLHKPKNYHVDKSRVANEMGIQIIHIFEYEWIDNADKIIQWLKSQFSNNTIIYARKCIIKEIDSGNKNIFLFENHLQGNDKSTIRLGLFYDDTLVSVMTFGKSRFNKHHKFELHRFCSKHNTTIVGGASKLFKHFLKTHNPDSIISYQDISKFNGNIYEKMGFRLSHISEPNYVWCDKKNNYLSRYQTQKHKLLELGYAGSSENSIMEARGYFKIYNCGNNVWVYKKEEQ